MRYQIDPERQEIQALRKAAEWSGKEVLEIGCGWGRLTRRIARIGSFVTGIDPDGENVRAAARVPQRRYSPRLRYCVGEGERLGFSSESFDIVILGWSL